jgi:tripartite-type tricarboxylate transporter receptor subunit TctC
MSRHRKSAIIAELVSKVALFAVRGGHAAEFPAHSIRLVVPYAAGYSSALLGALRLRLRR